jgi:uncharacterized lipoprotein YddW (UPF0748 family)
MFQILRSRLISRAFWFFVIAFMPFEHLKAQTAPKREFRGVWLSSVFNIDFPSSATATPEAQRADFIRILDAHRQMGMNAVFVQIRPSADALYPSTLEPWSQWLTGSQGRAPSPAWDPLQFMLEEAHKRGMEFHAWFNPFRSVVASSSSIAPNHISRTQPAWHLAYTSPYRLLNPGLPEVRSYVLSVIMDVLRRYDIDGVHFDDYFYPYEGTTAQDAETFRQYSRGIGNVADWRRSNVNLFVQAVSDSIRAVKPFVKFGISPFGIWRSGTPTGTNGLDAYSVIYCDALAWLNARSVDYVVPQLYWKFGGGQDYAKLMPWWNAQARQSTRQMYTGLGAYRLTDAAWTADDITRQVDFNRQQNGDGAVFFSSNSLTRDLQGLRTGLLGAAFRTQALPPTMPWKDSIPPNAPTNLRVMAADTSRSLRISWDAPSRALDGDTAVYYVLYRFSDSAQINLNDPSAIIAITPDRTWNDKTLSSRTLPASVQYAVTALDRLQNESAATSLRFTTTKVAGDNSFTTGLQSIAPNPAQTLTNITFSLERPTFVQLSVTDNLGRVIALPVGSAYDTGEYTVPLSTEGWARGVYFVRFLAGGVGVVRALVVQ